MKEIKLRAWDKKDKRMLRNTDLADALYCDNPNIIFKQYIGLKDKSGIEIYKGDIIDFHDEFDSSCPLYKLKEIKKGDKKLEVTPYRKIVTQGAWRAGEYELCRMLIDRFHILVIGNDCENPNLLKEIK